MGGDIVKILFYLKKWETFSVFLKLVFLDFIKQKLGHLKKKKGTQFPQSRH